MNARKSLLAAITAITLGGGALEAHARTGVPIVLDPDVAEVACFSLCNIIRANAERACEADVRADGEATATTVWRARGGKRRGATRPGQILQDS